MRWRITGIGVILLAVIAITSTAFKAQNNQNGQQIESQLPIVVRQLQPENGVIPVELKCGTVQLSLPNERQTYSCVIRNNTSKKIRSFSIIYTDITEQDGKELLVSRFVIFDMLVHPDFNESSHDKSISPGGEYNFTPSGPTRFENAVIKGGEARINHVEFDDGIALDPNKGGSKTIARHREGAAKYKQWLTQKYIESGKSLGAIASLIQKSPDSPSELGLNDEELEQGAEIFRIRLLRLYNTHGVVELEKFLNK